MAEAPGTRYKVVRNVAVLTMDSPPVNSLSSATRAGLSDGFSKAIQDPNVKAIVVCGAGRAFCAGAEISEFAGVKGNIRQVSLPDLIGEMEACQKPIVASIHGFALGGGLEVALGCHWRLADPKTQLGLPEVNLGLLPGAGGTQRLPRLVGAVQAAKMMVSGSPLPAKLALKAGVVDGLLDSSKDRVDQAIDFALLKAAEGQKGIRPICNMPVPGGYDKEALDKVEKEASASRRGEPAVKSIVDCVRAAAQAKSFADGMKVEQELFAKLLKTPEARALQYAFFAERAANKIPKQFQAEPAKIKAVGIIGSGTMGGGIAMCCADVGMNVFLLDIKQEFVEKGMSVIMKNYETSAARGRITPEQAKERFSRIKGTVSYDDLATCDIVVEAVFESMAIKKDVFGKLDKVCKKGCILASNTSRLNIDEIAASTSRPEDVIGCHFFSPANVMRILENVLGKKSSPRTVSTAMAFGAQIGKIPVLVGNCDGFVANRMMEWYSLEALSLAMEGAPIDKIDAVARKFGFAMGPLAMNDLVGIDVFARERVKNGKADPRRVIPDALFARDRLGQKSGKGYYDYIVPEGAKKGTRPVQTMSKEATEIIRQCAANNGIQQRTDITEQEIVERLIYPVINEGFEILEEGFAYKASDVDMVVVYGYNFPKTKGGPMHFANEVGLEKVLSQLKLYGAKSSTKSAKYWVPSKLLEECVSSKAMPDKVLAKKTSSSKL